MENTMNIRVFRLIADIKLPLNDDPNDVAECNDGNLLVSYDGVHVYAQDHSISTDDKEDGKNMSLLTIRLSFVEINPQFFEELT